MATIKAADAAPANDITTIPGWLAEFGAQVQRLSNLFDWCSAGTSYAYEYAGLSARDGSWRNGDARDPILGIPAAMLNDEGKARQAALTADELARLRAGAFSAAKRALQNNVSAAEVSNSLTALGIEGGIREVRYHALSIAVTTGTDRVLTPAGREAVEAAAREAVKAAVTAEGSTLIVHDVASTSGSALTSSVAYQAIDGPVTLTTGAVVDAAG
jgi:hypothetical protein